jgi:uncharacterized protein
LIDLLLHDARATRRGTRADPWRAGLLSFLLLLIASSLALAIEVPPLRGRVNDYAGVMSQDQVRALESQLAQFEQETGHQIAVLTIPTLDGEDIEGFSIRVAENWKIGKKGFDNGVILLVAVKDRKLRLEVGYGLEGILPDAIAKRITSDYIVPRFRAQDYAGGIISGIDAVEKVIKQEPLPESARKPNQAPQSDFNSLAMFAVAFVIFALMAFSSGRRRRNQMWSGRGRHYPPIFWGGGGFGGGGFGGGDSGGGFSGGGGGFGGGGASDSW